MPGIQHMVLLKFKPDVDASQIESMFSQLADLQRLIPGITYFAGGPYTSSEGLNQGYTHGFLMTFDSVESRDAYLPHPEHERIKSLILPCVDGAVAFDFAIPDAHDS